MGEKIDSDLLKSYRTIDTSRIGQCLEKQKNLGLSSAFSSPRADFFQKKEVISSRFKQTK